MHFSQARNIDIERRAEVQIKELQTTVAELVAELLEKYDIKAQQSKMDVNGINKD